MKKRISLTLVLGIMFTMAVAAANTPSNTDYALGNGYCHNNQNNQQTGQGHHHRNNQDCPYINQNNEK